MSLARKGIRRALLLDHRRDLPADLAPRLRAAGFEVRVVTSVAESERIADATEAWTLAILNPIVLQSGGVELSMLERLQRQGPMPAIVVVDSHEGLTELRWLDVPLRDFVVRPVRIEEIVHRAEGAAAGFDHIALLHERARELEGQVANDFKTDLLSERHFRSLLHVEFKRAQRNRTPLSLLLLDVDNFKAINDSTDYAFGDEVLRAVAATLRGSCRETDFPARFGGDEFVLLLPQTTPAEAVQTALRIRRRVAETAIRTERYATRVTISIGIDTYDGQSSSTPEELRRRANMALHEAKRRGKNQAWLYSDAGGDQVA